MRWLGTLLLVFTVGCGDDDAGGDAMVGDATADGGAGFATAPMPPAAPTLTPCPAGWSEVAGDVTTCEPWPAGMAPTCGDGEALFPDSGCTRIGAACPTGEFSDVLPPDAMVVFVRAGATGGDGTRASPFGTIDEGLAVAMTRMTVAIAAGTYDGTITIGNGVQVRGACPEQTILTTTDMFGLAAVVNADSLGNGLHDVSIQNPTRVGIAVTMGAELQLSGVVVERATSGGVNVVGGSVGGGDLLVRDTQPAPSGRFGRGLEVSVGGTLEVARADVTGSRDAAAIATGTGTLRLTNVALRDTMSQLSDSAFGRGLVVESNAQARIADTIIERNRDAAIVALDEDTLVELTDALVRDTQSRESDGLAGRGLNAQLGAEVRATRTAVERSRDVGVFLDGDGSAATLSDAVVRETAPREADDGDGHGLTAQAGATITARTALFSGNHRVGVLVLGSTATLEDVAVREMRAASMGRFGRGLGLQGASTATLTRVELERGLELGLFASGASTVVTATDLIVRDTLGQESTMDAGRAVVVHASAELTLERALLERNRDVSLMLSESAQATATDLVITDTAQRGCAATTCPGEPAGMGVGVYGGAAATISRFEIRRSALCAIHLDTGGELDLSEGLISDNAIPACVLVPDFALSRLMDGVRYVDNGMSPDIDLPTPEPSPETD